MSNIRKNAGSKDKELPQIQLDWDVRKLRLERNVDEKNNTPQGNGGPENNHVEIGGSTGISFRTLHKN